ncbi:hypothetical protein IWQ62_003242 [Dispira parvispora]|uniref:Uncharacterized protein n=1 Tax=Dispira parvispora TaxID=1520584 RepID=A0A9W8AR87_9FUNG|nr:hypothetical protein IWQ62_003242 [Dispira parvispora]
MASSSATLRDVIVAAHLVRQFLTSQGFTKTLATFEDEVPSQWLTLPSPIANTTHARVETQSADSEDQPLQVTPAVSIDQTLYRTPYGRGHFDIVTEKDGVAEQFDLLSLLQEVQRYKNVQHQAQDQVIDQSVLDIGTGYYPCNVRDIFDRPHGNNNVLFARLHEVSPPLLPTALTLDRDTVTSSQNDPSSVTQRVLITTGTDKKVLVWDVESHQILQTLTHHSGPVVTVDVCPFNQDLIVTGSLDGSAAIVNIRSGLVVQWFKALARRFIVRALFSPDDGQYLACASYDHTVHILVRSADTTGPLYRPYQTFQFTGAVEALCFARSYPDPETTHSAPGQFTLYLLCGIRHDPFLHYIDVGQRDICRYSLLGHRSFSDDALHCPWTPMDISVSPCGRFVCVSTDDRTTASGPAPSTPKALTLTPDGGRVIVFWFLSDRVVRQFYNAHCGSDALVSYPRHCWATQSKYIIVNGEPEPHSTLEAVDDDSSALLPASVAKLSVTANEAAERYVLQVLELATGKIVDRIPAHQNLIRSLWSAPSHSSLSSYLVSASFDKSVIIWG